MTNNTNNKSLDKQDKTVANTEKKSKQKNIEQKELNKEIKEENVEKESVEISKENSEKKPKKQLSKRDKKIAIIAGSTVGGILLLTTIIAPTVVVVTQNNKNIILDGKFLEKFSNQSIQQNLINPNNVTQDEFKNAIQQYAKNVFEPKNINVEMIKIETSDSTELLPGTYLKLSVNEGDNYKFIFDEKVYDKSKHFINNEQTLVLINIDVNFKFFQLYQISGIKEAYDALKENINLFENRYTNKEFAEKINNIMPLFYDKLKINNGDLNINDFIIKSTFDSDKEQVIVKLEENYKKYNIEENEFVKLNHETKSLVISNLGLYSYTDILNKEQLMQLWETVNQTIVSKDIRASSINPNLFDSRKLEIFEVFKNINAFGNKKLSDYILNPEQDITRELANIKIKLNLDPSIRLREYCLNDNYIDVDPKTNTISLNNLYIGNPEEYFICDETNMERRAVAGLTDQGKSEPEILIPPTAKRLKEKAFWNTRTIKKLIVCDTLHWCETNVSAWSTELTYAKWSKNIDAIPSLTFNYNQKITGVQLFNGIARIEFGCFYRNQIKGNMNNGDTFVLPPTATFIGQQAFESIPNINQNSFKELVTWGSDLGFKFIQNRDTLRKLVLMVDDANQMKVNREALIDTPSDLIIQVKNEEIKQKLIDACINPNLGKPGLNITAENVKVVNNLDELYPRDKYCPVHGIDQY